MPHTGKLLMAGVTAGMTTFVPYASFCGALIAAVNVPAEIL